MKKKIRINLVALIVIIIVICLVIMFFVKRKNDSKKVDIQFTNQLNYVTYTDDGGNYVIQYDNGDKTIETRNNTK